MTMNTLILQSVLLLINLFGSFYLYRIQDYKMAICAGFVSGTCFIELLNYIDKIIF